MSEPETRLLVCGQCKTIEPLDDFDGPPNRDAVLNALVDRHKDGVERRPHFPAQLARVKTSEWRKPNVQAEIISKIEESFGRNATTGLPSGAYKMVDTFRQDAMECWSQHLRTPDCSDYKSDAKRLVPDTKTERKEMGMHPRYDDGHPELTRYLCEYCPVHSLVQQANRKKAGLYDK